MRHEEHLDEVAIHLSEDHRRIVMLAQADDFFSGPDEDPSICTLELAHRDAAIIFRKYG